MRPRPVIALLVGLAAVLGFSPEIHARQLKKVPRVGFLWVDSINPSRLEAFRQGLRDLGYVEGQNLIIEYREAAGEGYRVPELAAELVALKPDVIVTGGGRAIEELLRIADKVPLVLPVMTDPVAAGWVSSLARPGGNVTGLTNFAPSLSGKWLEILKEAVPSIRHAAVLWAEVPAQMPAMKELQASAHALRVRLRPLTTDGPGALGRALRTARKENCDSLLVLPHPLALSRRYAIADFALRHKLPAIFPVRDFAEAGGLMSYAPDFSYNFRRAAVYVDKILKGAKPADLPVENPMKFELVINLQTARRLSLTIPPEVLMRADEMIR